MWISSSLLATSRKCNRINVFLEVGVRLATARAMAAAMTVTSQRETKQKVEWYKVSSPFLVSPRFSVLALMMIRALAELFR